MPPLGVTVTTRTAPPARGAPTDTDTLFVVGTAGTGPTTSATKVRSLSDFVTTYGARTTGGSGNAVLYDGLDNFFREGGKQAYVARYTTGNVATALALFDADLGPGQVAAWEETPGATTYNLLQAHAAANNRFALKDYANGDTVAAMTTLAQATTTNDDYGMFAGQWLNVPPPAGTIGGSARQVPGSSTLAALIARADALGNPNRAAAGRDFPLQYATSFTRDVITVDRESLIALGANVYANRYGVMQMYGFQTKIALSPDTPFWQANCSRARMWLVAQAQSVGAPYTFRPIDARGRLTGALKTDLDAVCLRLWSVDGLYGETPQDAFSTEVGASVNTLSTVAQGELHAVVEARFSPHARSVLIDLVSVPVTGNVTRAS